MSSTQEQQSTLPGERKNAIKMAGTHIGLTTTKSNCFSKIKKGQKLKKSKMKADILNMDRYGSMEMSNRQIMQHHYHRRQLFHDGLDELHKGVKKIKQIGLDINDELSKQEVVMDEIEEEMNQNQKKIQSNTKSVEWLSKTSTDTSCCCIMSLLFLIIVYLLYLNLS